MDKKRISNILTVVLLIILVAVLCFIFLQRKELQETFEQDTDIVSSTDAGIVDWIAAPKQNDIEQPDGFGVERQIVQNETENTVTLDSISGDGFSVEKSFVLAVNDDEVKQAMESLVEVTDDGKYKCAIDWSDYDISSSDYYVLLSLVGKLYEDKINNGSNDYTVIIKQPTVEQMEEVGIPVLFDIDVDGYLTMYCNVITQNNSTMTEKEELLVFTVYYEGDILTLKE